MTGLLLADQKYLADGEAFPGKDFRKPASLISFCFCFALIDELFGIAAKSSVIASLSSVTIAPITSAIRGVRSEVRLDENDGMKFPCAVNLHNTLTIPRRWLGPRLAQLSAVRLEEVCAALNFAIGCDV